MTDTAIRRMNFKQVDTSEVDGREQLAKDAHAVLGYKKLAQALVIPDALLFALRKLEIEPLVQKSVDAYKAKKAQPGMWSSRKGGYACAFGLVLASILGCLAFSSEAWREPFTPFWLILATASVIFGAILCTIGIIVEFTSKGSGERTLREWKLIPVAGYAGTIPEFVLSKAVQIKNELPKSELLIDQLFETVEKSPVPASDPFLVVRLKDETYYIDVWDEKEYEAQI